MRHYKPDVIAVDRNADKQALPDDFDVLAWYLTDPGFRQRLGQTTAWSGSAPGWDFYAREG
jgi:hypothetical protein